MAALPYIQLYVADYLADTAHLTAEEHGAYLLLIFNYWQRGQPLNASNNRLASVARMSNERWTVVEQTLREFFQIDGDIWSHKRIDADLARVNSQQQQRSEAGKASAKARNRPDSTVDERSFNGRSTNTDTYTETDKDTEAEGKNKKRLNRRHVQRPEGVDQQLWDDFKALRDKQRATITETSLAGIQREANKAGMSLSAALRECCERGWRGFKAEWMPDTRNSLEKQTDDILGIDRRAIFNSQGSDYSNPSGMAVSEDRQSRSGRGLVRFGE